MDANNVRQQWADRSGEYSPEYYAHYGPNETSELIRSALERYLDRDASILELGCSSGRHLARLHDDGFRSLTGIDINDEAFDVMAEAYPDLADAGTFHVGAIEDAVAEFDDGQFDAVYSAETLQHIHPDDEWVFAELARIAGDVLVTAEIEGPVADGESGANGESNADGEQGAAGDAGTDDPAEADVNYVHGEVPLYYRDWREVFDGLGFVQVDVAESKRDTVRTFRATEE